jgi:hypothetical protein
MRGTGINLASYEENIGCFDRFVASSCLGSWTKIKIFFFCLENIVILRRGKTLAMFNCFQTHFSRQINNNFYK